MEKLSALKENELPKLVSVIIPVYNAEKYLNSCVDSILDQTYTNIEVILINDKSTDNSLEIARKYTKKDKRVKLVSKETNQGINQARKTGFENAIGDYIMFVDDDDIIAKKLVEDHLNALSKTGADVSISKAFWWDDKTTLDIESIYSSGSGELKVLRKKLAYRSLVTETSPFSDTEVGMLWNKLHKRSYFEGYDWSLSNMPAEDFMTNALLLARVQSVVYIDKVHYFHRISSNSTMGQLNRKKGANSEQKIDIMDALFKVAEIFMEISKQNDWNFKNEIIYFKYRYFFIRMEAFIAGQSFSDKDYKKIKMYCSQEEVDRLCSDDFQRYIAEYIYHPAGDILLSLTDYWKDFSRSDQLSDFLERRIAKFKDTISQKDIYAKNVRECVEQRDEELRNIKTLKGSTTNFIGKIKHRVILRVLYMPKKAINWCRKNRLERRFENCWIVMDRVDSASDNGYAFYKYLLEKHPEINTYFAIKKNSIDVSRLKREGFNLVFIGTKEHEVAVQQSSRLFYAYFTFEYSSETAKRIFLGHGITKDDLPNPGLRQNDYFITTLDREQEFLSERVDMTPVKLGQPRYEQLLKKINESSKEKNKVVIAPTWRSWLYVSGYDIKQDEYFIYWQKFLESPELKNLSTRYKIIFIVHPMMVELTGGDMTSLFTVPSYIKTTTYADLGANRLQDVLISTNLLITDYSSIAFDAVLAGSKVIYFQFDKNTFRERGQLKQGWFDYERDGFGPVYDKYEDLVKNLERDTMEKYGDRANAFEREIKREPDISEKIIRLARCDE